MTDYRSPTSRFIKTEPPGVVSQSTQDRQTAQHVYDGKPGPLVNRFEEEISVLGSLLLDNPKVVAAFVNSWMAWMPSDQSNPDSALHQIFDAIFNWPLGLQLTLEVGNNSTRTVRTVAGAVTLFTDYRHQRCRTLDCSLSAIEHQLAAVEGDVSLWQWSTLLAWLVSYERELFKMREGASDRSQVLHLSLFEGDDILETHLDRSLFLACVLHHIFALVGELCEVSDVETMREARARVSDHVLECVHEEVHKIPKRYSPVLNLTNAELPTEYAWYRPSETPAVAPEVVDSELLSMQWIHWAFAAEVWREHEGGLARLCSTFWIAKAAIHASNSLLHLSDWTRSMYHRLRKT